MKLFVLVLLFLAGCGSGHVPKDINPNYADLGYRNIEFVVKASTLTPQVTSLGNATIMLKEGESIEGSYFEVNGLWQGVLTLYSQGCPWINSSVRYNGVIRFNLKDMMLIPTACQIRFTENVDAINGIEHNVHETGVVDIYILPTGKQPIEISYARSSVFGIKTQQFIGSAAIQRQAGNYTTSDIIMLTIPTAGGVLTINSSCSDIPKQRIEFKDTKIMLNLRNMYNQNFLSEGKDCDFFFMVVPMIGEIGYYGKIMVSTYKPEAVLLEYPAYSFPKNSSLKVSAADYVAINCINVNACSTFKRTKFNNEVTLKSYNTKDMFWVRSLTINGRKSVFAIQNGVVVWW